MERRLCLGFLLLYGRRELQGITEIKLHRWRTSNTGEGSQAEERMIGLG